MSSFYSLVLLLLLPVVLLLLLPSGLAGLNSDGVLLLSFKYSVLSDPLSALADWDYADDTPCSWNGVVCMGFPLSDGNRGGGSGLSPTASRVISLVLPDAQLLGAVAPELGQIEHLRHLDLSGNALNGSLPAAFFNTSSELRVLSLAGNEISGRLPDAVARLQQLQILNLSDNALAGPLPANLTLLRNLTVLSLAGNYFSGEVPGVAALDALQVLDLSSNLVNGTIPPDLGGRSLRYLNLSYNRLAGPIPPELGAEIPANSTIDLSFNNLTGPIPETGGFVAQSPAAFAGNPDLCGRPLKQMCTIPSTLSNPPPNVTDSKSPPAFAAIPKSPDANSGGTGSRGGGGGGLSPSTIIAIAGGDLAGVGILFAVFLYVYNVKRKRRRQLQQQQQQQNSKEMRGLGLTSVDRAGKETMPMSPSSPERCSLSCCLRNKSGGGDDDEDETEETSESSDSSDAERREEEEIQCRGREVVDRSKPQAQQQQGAATLVTVDGESQLELETLLKASAYILGAMGSSIVYKAVLADGTALAVRRIGESSCIDKFKDFDAQVRSIAKFRHPNLLRLRGFYWGADEKLLIHDYAPNGSLANISFSSKSLSPPFPLPIFIIILHPTT